MPAINVKSPTDFIPPFLKGGRGDFNYNHLKSPSVSRYKGEKNKI